MNSLTARLATLSAVIMVIVVMGKGAWEWVM